MPTDAHPKPSFSPRRKWSIGLNVFLIVLLVFSVTGMINYLSRDYFYRFYWSSRTKVELSPLTIKLLQSLTNRIKITIYYDKNVSLYGTISSLLNEYRLVSPKISLETVDYLRDPAAGQKVKDEYKLPATTDKDLVIFDCEGQLPIVLPGDALAKYIMEQLPSEKEIKFLRKPTEFFGEKMFTSALLRVTSPKPLNAYMLQGHGEHAIDSGDPSYGYLQFAAMLRQNWNIRVGALSLLSTNPVPADCNLLIIAGPQNAFLPEEIEKIDQYLSQGGRLFALFNFYSADKDIGLERILAKWGVEVGHNIIVDLETTGRTVDLVVTDFSTSHPVVNPLLQDMIDLIRPRSISRLRTSTQAADAPRVEELAFSGPQAFDKNDPHKEPHRFPLMVAVEKAAPKGIVNERGASRIVVVGDSIFLANTSIASVANRDFGGYAVNWLLDRPQLLEAIGPRPILTYKLIMTKAQLQRAEWLLLGAMPGAVLIFGTLVWFRRRQ